MDFDPEIIAAIIERETPKIVESTVRQTLLQLGIDSSKPLEVQADMRHLREWRETTETIKSRSLWAVWGCFLAGAGALLWIGLTDWAHSLSILPPK